VKHNYSTRRNRVVDYSRLNKGITKDVVEEINLMLEYNCHMTFKQASNKFGNDAVRNSGHKEMKQMIDKDVMIFITPDEARKKRKDGFKFTRTFMFYKDKYGEDGSLEKLKDRFCNIELKNHKHPYGGDKTSPPNAGAESINCMLAEAAEEELTIAVMDVEGAYLNAEAGDIRT
jgi:hypothetical protein